jgi:hypothetical protein
MRRRPGRRLPAAAGAAWPQIYTDKGGRGVGRARLPKDLNGSAKRLVSRRSFVCNAEARAEPRR